MITGTKIQLQTGARIRTFTFGGEIDFKAKFPALYAQSDTEKQWVLTGPRGGVKVLAFLKSGATCIRALTRNAADEFCTVVN